MRIAFITLGYRPLRMSGFDVSGERLVDALLQAGHQVTVIAATQGSLTETHLHPALEIYRLPLGRSNWIGYAYRATQMLYKLSRCCSFDVVHFWDVHFSYAYQGQFVASLHQSFQQRLQTLDRSNHLYVFRLIYYYLAQICAEKPSLHRAKGLLSVSTTTRDEFIRSYNVSPNHIMIARHGIDTNFFKPAANTKMLRLRLGLAENEPIILFVGFITPRKGLNYLLQSLPLIRPTPRLLIIGRWNKDSRSKFFSALGNMADRLIEVGYIPDEEMPQYYTMADIYVSASLLEGFGLPLAEALACETPVVATKVGAVAEVIGPGGILVPPRDHFALAQAISQLLTNHSLRLELGRQGRLHIIRQFSIRAMLHDTLAAYQYFLTQ